MSEHRIEIETVAEVEPVYRQTVEILRHDDEGIIHLMQFRYGELQSITFPIAKAAALAAAIQKLAAD